MKHTVGIGSLVGNSVCIVYLLTGRVKVSACALEILPPILYSMCAVRTHFLHFFELP